MEFNPRQQLGETESLQNVEYGTYPGVNESATEVIAVIKIPGIQDKQDIEIDVENNILNIMGDIKKSFNLPCDVNEEVIRTHYEGDTLEIRLQKTRSDNKTIGINIH